MTLPGHAKKMAAHGRSQPHANVGINLVLEQTGT